MRSAVLVVCAGVCMSGCSSDRRSPDPPELVVETPSHLPMAPRPQVSTPERLVSPDSPRPGPGQDALVHIIRGNEYEGWVVPPTSDMHFQPMAADIAVMERELAPAMVAAAARGDIPDGLDISTYVRQYSGYRKDSHHVIEVRLICAQARHLAQTRVRVQGGGSCFLHTAYDIENQQFLYFRRNPE